MALWHSPKFASSQWARQVRSPEHRSGTLQLQSTSILSASKARFPSWCGHFGWMLKLRSTKGEELGKTEVKPTVSASESGDHLTLRQPKNWKTQLKEDLVLPDLGESISWKWWFWTLENTPQLRMTKDWTSLGGFTAKHRCPPKMFQTGMTCSSAVEAPGCAFSRKILVMASCFGEI